MIFHIFNSQEERRKFGGSCFIELQYCELEQNTDIKTIVSVESIKDWKNDSLYIYGDDENEFWSQYKEIFTGGIYNNGQSGVVDLYGINFYSRKQTEIIIEKIKKMKPKDYPVLLRWLEKVDEYIGFYILGI